jgi:carbonic anhydrase
MGTVILTIVAIFLVASTGAGSSISFREFARFRELARSMADFSYDAQDEWGGVCVHGNEGRQSPVDIDTDDTNDEIDLPQLEFTDWDTGYDGRLTNNGHSIQFDPNAPGQATTETMFGEYALQQVHMHWGKSEGEGSEHTVDDEPADFELHLVHTKKDPNQGGHGYMVIGVFGKAVRMPMFGPWQKLDPEPVKAYGSSVDVDGFRFDRFLPQSKDYYMYSGGLTTPPCTEDVLWHVMKQKILVPKEFLKRAREIIDGHGNPLTHNFRFTQKLNDRVIFEVETD